MNSRQRRKSVRLGLRLMISKATVTQKKSWLSLGAGRVIAVDRFSGKCFLLAADAWGNPDQVPTFPDNLRVVGCVL
jgi:hypothetical protein